MKERIGIISIPVHPDDEKVPVSVIHIPISNGRYVTVCGPLGRKTISSMLGTLEACKDSLVMPESDFQI